MNCPTCGERKRCPVLKVAGLAKNTSRAKKEPMDVTAVSTRSGFSESFLIAAKMLSYLDVMSRAHKGGTLSPPIGEWFGELTPDEAATLVALSRELAKKYWKSRSSD